jgi:hypothetical protein
VTAPHTYGPSGPSQPTCQYGIAARLNILAPNIQSDATKTIYPGNANILGSDLRENQMTPTTKTACRICISSCACRSLTVAATLFTRFSSRQDDAHE